MAKGGKGVGYGSPPREHQFKPGKSGNPRGRPRGSLNVPTVLGKMLSERVAITEKGRRKSITKFEASIKQQVNKAAAGDPHAFKAVMGFVMQFGEKLLRPVLSKEFIAALPKDELRILARVIERIHGRDDDNESDYEQYLR